MCSSQLSAAGKQSQEELTVEMAASSLSSQKRALRKLLSSTLQRLSSAAVQEQSQAVAARILSFPSFQRCKSVSCYLSMPSGELDTSTIVSAILEKGQNLFVPKVISASDNEMDFLKIYGTEDLNSLSGGLWGIKEPSFEWQGSPRQRALGSTFDGLDMILLPGVAFDKSLSRLGHGKGYYDHFITAYSSTGRPRPLLVALALREQFLEGSQVPVGDRDWKMDLIVTPDGIFGSEGKPT